MYNYFFAIKTLQTCAISQDTALDIRRVRVILPVNILLYVFIYTATQEYVNLVLRTLFGVKKMYYSLW